MLTPGNSPNKIKPNALKLKNPKLVSVPLENLYLPADQVDTQVEMIPRPGAQGTKLIDLLLTAAPPVVSRKSACGKRKVLFNASSFLIVSAFIQRSGGQVKKIRCIEIDDHFDDLVGIETSEVTKVLMRPEKQIPTKRAVQSALRTRGIALTTPLSKRAVAPSTPKVLG